MAVKASVTITLSIYRDTDSVTRYYLLQSSTLSTPSKPTAYPPTGDWDDTEPGYTSGSTNSLYFVDCTVFSDGTYQYSDVSLSSSYEAAKEAYNLAVAASEAIDNLSVGGRNYLKNTRTMSGWYKSSNVTLEEDDEGCTVATWAATDTLGWNAVWNLPPIAFSALRGQSVVLSFDVRSDDYEALNTLTSQGLVVAFALCTADSTTRTLYRSVGLYTTALSDSWTRVTVTATLTDDYFSQGSGDIDDDTRFYIQIYDYSVYSMQVRKCKLEIGNVATDWSPAPEDAETAIEEVITIVNGKTTSYYVDTVPSGTDYTTGDIWFDTGNDNAMYYWNGSAWTLAPLGTDAIADGAITADLIAAGAVTAGKISSGAVTTDKLAANAVTAAKIAASTITSEQIAASTITGDNIAASTITAGNLVAGTITSNEIASGTITASNIASGTITAKLIATGTITGDNIAAETITGDNLVANTITATQIATSTITANELASNSVTTAKLAANAVTAAKIAAGTITATQIAANTITGDNIAADTITADNLSVDKLSAITGNVGTLTSGILQSANYNADTGTGLLIDLDNGTITGSDLTLLATQLSNLSVGGRNLILDSEEISATRTNSAVNYLSDKMPFMSNSDYGFAKIQEGGEFTLSFDYEINNITTACSLTPSLKYSSSSYGNIGATISLTVGDNSGHFSHTFTPSTAQMQYGTAWLLSGFGAGNNADVEITLSHVKLETGNVETDWTPAPEDTDDQIAAKLALTVDDEGVARISANAERIELEAGDLVVASGNFTLTEDGAIAANAGTIGPLHITNTADTDKSTGHYTTTSVMLQNLGVKIAVNDIADALDDDTAIVDMEWGLKDCGTNLDSAVMYLCVKDPNDDWSSKTAPRLFYVTGNGQMRCCGLELYPNIALDYNDGITFDADEIDKLCAYTDDEALVLHNVKFNTYAVGSTVTPSVENTYNLGSSGTYWKNVYCDTIYRNSTASTSSDRKLKQDIKPLTEAFESFIMGLTPVSFAYKNGHRTHMGFEAQGVKDVALSTVGDLALFRASVIGDDKAPYSADIPDEKLRWYLSYEELIAPLVAMVQHQQRRIERLEAALNI